MRYALDHGADRDRAHGLVDGRRDGAAGADAVAALAMSSVGVVLESPVVDWVATLDFQGDCDGLPPLVRAGVLTLLKQPLGRGSSPASPSRSTSTASTSCAAPPSSTPRSCCCTATTTGSCRSTASRALAAARPDIVTFEAFEVARHTKLWNYDRTRWEDAIRDWLPELPLAEERAAASRSA